MTSPAVPPVLSRCPHCGAHVQPQAARCWLCFGDIIPDMEPVVAELAEPPAFSGVVDRFFQVVTIGIGLIVLLIVVGTFRESVPAGITLIMVLFLPFTVAAVRLQLRKQKQGRVTWGERLATYLLSTVLMFMVLGLLVVAAFVAFVIWCLVAAPTMNFH